MAGIDPLPPDWSYLPVAQIMSPTDLFGAEFRPGFHPDNSRWKLWVGSDGLLSQVVRISKPFEGVEPYYAHHHRRIGIREARSVVRLAERVGFAKFQDKYESGITDLPTMRIALRLTDKLKVVETDWATDGFEEIWRRIHRYAPVSNGLTPWWSCGRIASLVEWCFKP